MDSKNINIKKNLVYSVSANFVTMLISVISILFFPRFLGINNYSFYQLYLFYISFAGIFHYGLVDGILLQYAGQEYNELKEERLDIQYKLLVLIEGISLITFIVSYFLLFNYNGMRFNILFFSGLSIVVTNIRSFALAILQSTNRIFEYSNLTRIDRVLFIIPAMVYLIAGGKNLLIILILDLIFKLLSALYGFYLIYDLKNCDNKIGLNDLKSMIYLSYKGLSLTLSFVISQLIIGTVRIGIEKKWSIIVFGKVSLTLSLSSMFITFINAIGSTLFPYLRKMNNSNLSSIYKEIRLVLMLLSFGLLILYYPFSAIVELWLPSYEESIRYMGVLFPIFIYESKTSLLTTTFLKTIRQEKKIFLVNFMALLLSVLFVLVSIFLMENLELAVLSILVLLIIRADLLEAQLSKLIKIKTRLCRTIECILTLIFVLCNLYLTDYLGVMVYVLFYVTYFILNKKSVMNLIMKLRRRIQK